MFSFKNISIYCALLVSFSLFSQKDSLDLKIRKTNKKFRSMGAYDPLKPAKAAFYSAIFPGMGQLYNRRYWLAPVIWGGMATSLYYYTINNNDYKRYRTAFRLREAGLKDEFTVDDVELLSRASLISAQKTLRNNRDLSLLTTIGIYALQIIEASVNAHLLQFNTDDDLTFEPLIITSPIQFDSPKFGLTIKYTF